jgi:hypothetical protein
MFVPSTLPVARLSRGRDLLLSHLSHKFTELQQEARKSLKNKNRKNMLDNSFCFGA